MNENRRLKIFLCHSKDDKPKIRKLYSRLIADHFDVWFDEVKLIPGQDWDFEIQKAVRNSDTVVVCLSNDSITKEGYIQKEIRFALDIADEKPEGTIFLIPVRLEDCRVPSRISRYQWIDLFSRNSYKRLIESLRLRMNDLKIRFGEDEILLLDNNDYIKIPVFGIISADVPIPVPTSDFTAFAETINIPRKFLPPKENGTRLFALQVTGNGMKDARINDQDVIVLKPASKAKNGEMVAIWFADRNESTLKYFYKEVDKYRLQSANPEMKPIYIKKDDALEIKGKVVMVIRKTNSG